MNEKMDIPAPQYTIIEVLKVCLAMARRGLEESRAIAIEFQRLATELREFVRVPGPEGKRGPKGEDGAQGLRGEQGKQGPIGPPGLGFDDLDILYDGRRTFTFKLDRGIEGSKGEMSERGEHKKVWVFKIPATIDAGVWKEGSYEAGDQVTFRGDIWVATCDTDLQPDLSKDGTPWRMQMRKPRDGRDGKPGERGIQGPKGDRGEPGPRAYSG